MKPWIVSALVVLTTIGIAECTQGTWYVQELVEYDAEGDLFSQEGLLPLHRQTPHPQTPHQGGQKHPPAKSSPQKVDGNVVVMTSKDTKSQRHHGNAKDAVDTELEDQHLIPVQTGSKQKSKPVPTSSASGASPSSPKSVAKQQPKTVQGTPQKKNKTTAKKESAGETATGRRGGERKLLSRDEEPQTVVDEDGIAVEVQPEPKLCEEPEKDVDCLFEEEELIPVIKKPKKKPQPKKAPAPKSTPAKAKEPSKQDASLHNSDNKNGAAGSEGHVQHRKLLQVDAASAPAEVSNQTKIDIEAKATPQGETVQQTAGEKTGEEEEKEEAEEEKEDEEDEGNLLWRVRRQVINPNDNTEGSGTEPTTEALPTVPTTTVFPDSFTRTREDATYVTEGWETKIDTRSCSRDARDPVQLESVKEALRKELEKYFYASTHVVTFDIQIRANGRNQAIATFSLKLSGLEPNPEDKIDDIVNGVNRLADPIFNPSNCNTDHSAYNRAQFVERLNNTLSNPCLGAPNGCAVGYNRCQLQYRGVGRCEHRCLSSNLNTLCRNSECVIDSAGAPSCQCPNEYTGMYCQNLKDDGSRPPSEAVTSNVTVAGFLLNVTNPNLANLTDDQIKEEAMRDIRSFLEAQNMTDFDIADVNITRTPEGVSVSWNLKLGNTGGNLRERAELILRNLGGNANLTFSFINTTFNVPRVDLGNLAQEIYNVLQNRCANVTCAFGYTCSIPYEFGMPECIHNCYSNAYEKKCQHGTCQLDYESGAPYCLCTNDYQGEFCNQTRSSDTRSGLTPPEIIGTTAGALIIAGAVASCCCWFLLCRKKSNKDISFSYLEDQDQDVEGFSDASSKLYQCYVDRPRVTVEPLDIYGMNQEFHS